MGEALRAHWPEYLMEAAGLGLFMVAVGLVGTALESPASPLHGLLSDPELRRVPMGVAMGLTAIAIIYSPWGQQSGAHINPAVTLTFLRLGKIAPWDAFFYVLAQLMGGVAGVVVVLALLGGWFSEPPVRYVATLPGRAGVVAAFLAEVGLSFILMMAVLVATNAERLSRFTGLFAGVLVASFIVVEAPISGMSINPARSFASAAPGGLWASFWIYVIAPPLGMLLAAQVYLALRGRQHIRCAKLNHHTRRRCIFNCAYGQAGAIVLLALGSVLGAVPASAGNSAPAVVSVGITVSDVDRSADFFTRVLDFEPVGRFEASGEAIEALTGVPAAHARIVRMRLGDELLELTQYLGPRGTPIPIDSRSNDLWFQHAAIVVRDMDAAYARIREHRVQHVSTAPQRLPDWNPSAGGIRAFYFRDPDGHNLELIWFPAGKGSPRWHEPSERLFLGIDHTAIAVADTPRSLRFYRDLLGLRVAGESENWGIEQEHLNLVFGARLRITGLAGRSGPGIEFLDYLTPPDGRPMLGGVRPNDLVHWETTLVVDDLDAVARRLRGSNAHIPSRSIVALPEKDFGFDRALLVRGPDGHALRLVER